MAKRQRTDTPSWYKKLVDEIVSQGGFVHSSLQFSESSRVLTVTADKGLEKDSLVLKIPRRNLICIGNETDHQDPWLSDIQEALDPSKLTFPLADVLTACLLTRHHRTYLESLPHRSTWDALPRRWGDDEVKKYLKGSPLLSRVMKSKEGVRGDYEQLCDVWKGDNKPSFDKFNDMLCAVTSRAFADESKGGIIVMVPILDLCNHARGMGEKKNLTFSFSEDGSVVVKTSQNIKKDEGLRLTYGAQSNSQLLLNYGFTIPNNIEPDGSSNDFLEFSCEGSDQNQIALRTGPKAYCYGGFVKALEQTESRDSDDLIPEGDDDGDDMEAFLNECDESEEVDIYGEIKEDGSEGNGEKDAIQEQVDDLHKLREILLKRMNEYDCKGTIMKEQLLLPKTSAGYYCALLIQSEQRCLYFFYRATQKIESLLLEKELSKSEEFDISNIDEDDVELIEQQTSELSDAYIKIRRDLF